MLYQIANFIMIIIVIVIFFAIILDMHIRIQIMIRYAIKSLVSVYWYSVFRSSGIHYIKKEITIHK